MVPVLCCGEVTHRAPIPHVAGRAVCDRKLPECFHESESESEPEPEPGAECGVRRVLRNEKFSGEARGRHARKEGRQAFSHSCLFPVVYQPARPASRARARCPTGTRCGDSTLTSALTPASPPRGASPASTWTSVGGNVTGAATRAHARARSKESISRQIRCVSEFFYFNACFQ